MNLIRIKVLNRAHHKYKNCTDICCQSDLVLRFKPIDYARKIYFPDFSGSAFA